tara:strand:- start:133 stop:747 length:615 start_codon:yes stop_codon:yes gene_type:complete
MLIFRVGTAAAPFVMAAARSKQADRLLKSGARVVGKVGSKSKDVATRVVNKLNRTSINTANAAPSGTSNMEISTGLELVPIAQMLGSDVTDILNDPKSREGAAFMASNLIRGKEIMTGDDRPTPKLGQRARFDMQPGFYPRRNNREYKYQQQVEKRALGGDVADTNLESMDDVGLLINVLNNSGSSPDQINAYMQEHLVNTTGE